MKKLAILFILFTLYSPLLSVPGTTETAPLVRRAPAPAAVMGESAPPEKMGATPFWKFSGRITEDSDESPAGSACSTCFMASFLTALCIPMDIVTTPCVWNNRKKDPESKKGKNHYCYWTRRVIAESGVKSVHVQGLNSAYPNCTCTCAIPDWDSEEIFE